MNIDIFENVLLNTILIVFPILLYLLLNCYKNELSKKYNDILLTISLITSLYLCFRFGMNDSNNKILLFCNIPIVIALMKKKLTLGITLALLDIINYYLIYNGIIYITIIKYLSYFLLYICSSKKKLSTEGFILCIAVIQGFFLSFEYFFKDLHITLNGFIELIILVFVYYFITFLILYIFKLIEKVRNLNNAMQLLEKDKIIKDSLFKLTHEIKNPLAVIKGYTDMINLDNREKSVKYLNIIKDETNRSLNIINDFLEFNKIKIVKNEIDLNMLLEDVYDSFSIIIDSSNVKLIYNKDDNDIYYNGDYDRLKQVLVNLIKNSVESIDKKGKVTLSINELKKYIDIVVADTGCGMAEDALNQIKDMFYTTKKNGNGLGVALSNEIIKAHNGELIYSSKLNEGTKAIIRLPK